MRTKHRLNHFFIVSFCPQITCKKNAISTKVVAVNGIQNRTIALCTQTPFFCLRTTDF
jgi:hypothetical protein